MQEGQRIMLLEVFWRVCTVVSVFGETFAVIFDDDPTQQMTLFDKKNVNFHVYDVIY